MAYQDDVLAVLRSMDGTLKQLLAMQRQVQPKPVAADRDLDSAWGNPVVKFNPRDWTGDSYKGQRMSACPPAFLDLLAETLDYFAIQADQKQEVTAKGKSVASFKRADAARARGWAKRSREGYVVPMVTGNGHQDHSQWATGDGDDGF